MSVAESGAESQWWGVACEEEEEEEEEIMTLVKPWFGLPRLTKPRMPRLASPRLALLPYALTP